MNSTIFVDDLISFLECFKNLKVCVKHKKKLENIFIYKNFLKYLVFSRNMNKKSAKTIDSNLRNVTKAPHVPKRDMCSKCGIPLKQ